MLLDPEAMLAQGQCTVLVRAGLTFILLNSERAAVGLGSSSAAGSSQAWHPLSLEVVSFSVT